MSTRDQRSVGVCPACETSVPPARVLIEYEADGEPRMYAECPDCLAVVRPRPASSPSRSVATDAADGR